MTETPPALVITTIAPPTRAVLRFRELLAGWHMIVVGDRKTPSSWDVDGVDFIRYDAPPPTAAELANLLPYDSYSRKNIGYIVAIAGGASTIVETDDDNYPYDAFGTTLHRCVRGIVCREAGWVNVYQAFTTHRIWPRGLPLRMIGPSLGRPLDLGGEIDADCPIQQYLADGDPDVDAIYRLVDGRNVGFAGSPVILEPGTWSPFNSQNTVWWPPAYRLLYLPSHVSFRVTDIWRGLIATAVGETRGWSIAFLPPTVRQERNPHDLLKDFADEVPAYLENARILEHMIAALAQTGDDASALRAAYEELLAMGLVPKEELHLVDAWNKALDQIGVPR
jgi:hypothetical protein